MIRLTWSAERPRCLVASAVVEGHKLEAMVCGLGAHLYLWCAWELDARGRRVSLVTGDSEHLEIAKLLAGAALARRVRQNGPALEGAGGGEGA